MGRFPFLKRLLVAILFWPTQVTSVKRIWSRTEVTDAYFHITDDEGLNEPANRSFPLQNFTLDLRNVTFKVEKAILTFPSHGPCGQNKKQLLQNFMEVLEIFQNLGGISAYGICKGSFVSELLDISKILFPLKPRCTPSWAGVTGRNYTLGEVLPLPEFSIYSNSKGNSEVFQKRMDGKWTNAIGNNFKAKEYRFETSVGNEDRWAVAILVDHLIVSGVPKTIVYRRTKVTGGSLEKPETRQTGYFFFRVYTPDKDASLINDAIYTYIKEIRQQFKNFIFDLDEHGILTVDYSRCDGEDVCAVSKFFQAFADAWNLSTGWATLAAMIGSLVLMAVAFLLIYLALLFKWFKKDDEPKE